MRLTMEQVTGANVQQSPILSVWTSMCRSSEVIVSPSRTRSRFSMVYRQMRAASRHKSLCDLITAPNGWNVSIKSWSVKSSGILTTKRFAPGGPFCPVPPVIHTHLSASAPKHTIYAPPLCHLPVVVPAVAIPPPAIAIPPPAGLHDKRESVCRGVDKLKGISVCRHIVVQNSLGHSWRPACWIEIKRLLPRALARLLIEPVWYALR